MLKQFLSALVALCLAVGLAHAAVDVNKADQPALDGIRGIGPATSKRILEEREKGGQFKDWSDFIQRVKGIKDKSAAKLSANGLTVNGQPLGQGADKADKSDKSDKVDRKDSSKSARVARPVKDARDIRADGSIPLK